MNKTEKIRQQTYISSIIIVAALVHVFIGAYFAIAGIHEMVLLSIFDIGTHAVALLINRMGKTRLASIIFVVKVISYSIIITLLIGTGVNAQWVALLAIVPAALYLDLNRVLRIIIVASSAVIINLTMFLASVFTPPINMHDDAILSFFFANVLLVGLISSFLINILINFRMEITHAREIEEITHISNIDPLTMLKNRRFADKFFATMEAEQMPFLFCMIDIDDFKMINDTRGHESGDMVLEKLAEILTKNTRQTDLVCRWGGEEFLVGIPNCNVDAGKRILEKIRAAVEAAEIETASGKVYATITVGASMINSADAESVKAAINESDKKLYEGKRSGKNRVIV